MLDSFLSGFADISLLQLALIAGMALLASVVGGVAGYGTGALMPLVLVPIMGAEPVVPILSLSALLTNTSRTAAFHRYIDGRRALIVLIAAVPTCALGAWAYTRLSGVGARGGAHQSRPRRGGVRLGTARRRHGRRRNHPALAVDGRRPRRRGGGGDR